MFSICLPIIFFAVLNFFYFDIIFKIAENITTLNIEFQEIIFSIGSSIDWLKSVGCPVLDEVVNRRFYILVRRFYVS